MVIATNKITMSDIEYELVLKPAQAVTNRIWLAYRQSERQLPKILRML